MSCTVPVLGVAVDSIVTGCQMTLLFTNAFSKSFHSRVFNVLRRWVDFHYYDFQRDPELLTQLYSFIATVKEKKMQKLVASLNKALEKVY